MGTSWYSADNRHLTVEERIGGAGLKNMTRTERKEEGRLKEFSVDTNR